MKAAIQEKIPLVCFILLFPVFFFYQYAIGSEIIPPFLGGYFGIVALCSFIPLLISQCSLTQPFLINKATACFFIILLITLGRALIDYDYQSGIEGNEFPAWLATGALFMSVCYLISRHLPTSSRLNYALIVSLFFMCLLSYASFIPYGKFGFYESAYYDHVSTYQGTGRSILVIALTALALSKSIGTRAVIFMIATLALLLNGARSEVVFFVASSLSFLFLKYKVRALYFIFALALDGFAFHLIDTDHSSGVFTLLQSPESSSSLEARVNFSKQAWDSISHSWFVGAPGDYVEKTGLGSYAHNLLSAWVNLGILGMTLYLAALLAIAHRLLSAAKPYRDSPQWGLSFLFFITTLIAFIFAKDHTYMLFGLAVGFSSRPFQQSSPPIK